MKKFILSRYYQIKNFYLRYERILMPASLVVGFLFDYFTFTSIKIGAAFIILFIYWFIAGIMIIFIQLCDSQKLSATPFFGYTRIFAPFIVQFTFGALLGASFVFYWFSGAFSASWPIIAILVALMVFNDTFRHYFEKPLTQISVYFFTTISLFSLFLPFLFNSLSEWLFVTAGVASIAVFSAGILIMSFWIKHIREEKMRFFILIIGIFAVMNVFYFSNIIPPIPLALREAGVYHSIQTSGGKYVMLGEKENFLRKSVFGQILHIQAGERAYLYTAIFAPAELKTDIVHRWQYYNDEEREWIDREILSFTVNGGRKEGYRGYSWRNNLAEGKWRVSVENRRGQVLGRVRFLIKKADISAGLQQIIR